MHVEQRNDMYIYELSFAIVPSACISFFGTADQLHLQGQRRPVGVEVWKYDCGWGAESWRGLAVWKGQREVRRLEQWQRPCGGTEARQYVCGAVGRHPRRNLQRHTGKTAFLTNTHTLAFKHRLRQTNVQTMDIILTKPRTYLCCNKTKWQNRSSCQGGRGY